MCVSEVCVSEVCVSEVFVSEVFVSEVCVSEVCVSEVFVSEGCRPSCHKVQPLHSCQGGSRNRNYWSIGYLYPGL